MKTLFLSIALMLSAASAFASETPASVTGVAKVQTIFCFRAPCPAPFVTLTIADGTTLTLTGEMTHGLMSSNGALVTVDGELSADGKSFTVKRIAGSAGVAGDAGSNVTRSEATKPTGAPATAQRAASGAGVAR